MDLASGTPPYEHLALSISKADLSYVTAVLLASAKGSGAIRLWHFVQYGALVAYEAKTHFERAQGWDLQVAWTEEVAAAARTSGKFFEDKRMLVDGVVGHFQALTDSNRGTFFPPSRLAPWLDIARNDLAVGVLGRVPVITNVSGHFLTGMDTRHVTSWEAAGKQGHLLASGIRSMASLLVGASELELHSDESHVTDPVSWWDGKSEICFSEVFGGELPAPLAAAVITIQGTCALTEKIGRTRCCPDCEFAALKHRFIALYQAIKSLDSLAKSSHTMGPVAKCSLDGALGSPQARAMLDCHDYRSLRNGLVHLGFADVRDRVPGHWTRESVVRAYSGHDLESLMIFVDAGLKHLAEALTEWLLVPAGRGGLFKCLSEQT